MFVLFFFPVFFFRCTVADRNGDSSTLMSRVRCSLCALGLSCPAEFGQTPVVYANTISTIKMVVKKAAYYGFDKQVGKSFLAL